MLPMLVVVLIAGVDSAAAQPAHILYVNPVHLLRRNITVGYEQSGKGALSLRFSVSGGVDSQYVFLSAGVNRRIGHRAPVQYVLGVSVLGYESPIKTGVPITSPFNRFFESGTDRYFIGTQVSNGVLLRTSRVVWVSLDAAIGPAFDISGRRWLTVWAVNLNLGFPF